MQRGQAQRRRKMWQTDGSLSYLDFWIVRGIINEDKNFVLVVGMASNS